MKAVLFDVDDTLYDQVIPFQKAYEELFKGSFELSIEELYKRSRYYSDEVWIVNTKLNNFFKGILTIFNWG